MISEAQRKRALDQIRENLVRRGLHVYVVSGGAIPRFAYTIGLSSSIGAELILAGAAFFMKDQVLTIINDLATQLKSRPERNLFEVNGLGSFTLPQVHHSWAAEVILGAYDYYQKRDIPALQIVPDQAHWTVDVPDMSTQWNAATSPIWQWLRKQWTYPVPEDSTAATDLAALRGKRIMEVMRWEEDEWEIFAGDGPDISEGEMRVVPLGTVLGADKSLLPAVHLAVGEGLLRDHDAGSEWRPWLKQERQQ